jgi:hypothetical protein
MAWVELPDPSMHTVYIVDPRDVFTRYAAAFAATARLREGAQAGFLVFARLAYLAFGALPGFFVTRYFLALITVVPAYLLVRRLYGIPAAAMVVVVLLSNPVIVTAWGTDYPDCAVVSYVAGAVACLAMPCRERWRPAWIAAGCTLLTLSMWSHGMGVVLAGTTAMVYVVVRLARDRPHIWLDSALMAGVVAVATLLLMVASLLVLGRFDFIGTTIQAARYLNQPYQIAQWHSSNWRWAPYVAYLLVPPSVIVAFGLTFARRARSVRTPQLYVGLACAAQFVVFCCLQFGYHVQTLEMHFFSSTIWGPVCLTLGLTIAELARPLWDHRVARWLPLGVVVIVPLAYEADRNVPAFGWWPYGVLLAAIPIVLVGIVRPLKVLNAPRVFRSVHQAGHIAMVSLALVGLCGSLLVLTVAPRPKMPRLSGLAKAGDPVSNYNTALGGSATAFIDWYEVSASLPSFVGNATYNGEQLLMWFLSDQPRMVEPVGIYHEGFDSLGRGFPVLTATDRAKLASRRPAELLIMGTRDTGFAAGFKALARYRAVVLRKTVLRDGSAVLYAWLVELKVFARQ